MTSQHLPIDLDLHKAIEAHRQSLEESQVTIVKRVLGIATSLSGAASPSDSERSADDSLATRVRLPRRGGTYRVQMFEQVLEAHSLKETLKKAILLAEEKTPGFIEKLALHRTSRGRRIVARKPAELYPGKPTLVENCAEQLDQKWWYDTNISKAQCRKYLGVLAQVGRFSEPRLDG